jgi:hypothetical protein
MSRWIAVLSASLLLACNPSSSGSSASGGCTKDTDCKADRICQAGQCVAPAAPTVAAATTSAPPSMAVLMAQQAALKAQIDDSNAKEAKLQAQLAAAKSPAEVAAIQAALDGEMARNRQLQQQAGGPGKSGKPCNCTPGDPLCSCL